MRCLSGFWRFCQFGSVAVGVAFFCGDWSKLCDGWRRGGGGGGEEVISLIGNFSELWS